MTSLPRGGGGGEDYRCSTTKGWGESNVDVDTHNSFNVVITKFRRFRPLLVMHYSWTVQILPSFFSSSPQKSNHIVANAEINEPGFLLLPIIIPSFLTFLQVCRGSWSSLRHLQLRGGVSKMSTSRGGRWLNYDERRLGGRGGQKIFCRRH